MFKPAALVAKIQTFSSRLPFLKRWTPGDFSSIGLDIGVSSIKAVRLSRSGERLSLLRQAVVSVPAEAPPQARAQAVQEALRLLGPEKGPLFTGISGPGTVLRLVTVPRMTAEELKTALTFESEKYIPFKLDEVFLDFGILEELSGGRMEVILAAARKELVGSRLDLLSSAGVVPQGVDLEAVALANAWGLGFPSDGAGQAQAQPAGLVHLGARGTILVFLTGTKLEFTREIALGGESFTQAVAAALQVGPPDAERIKCDPGGHPAAVRSALQPVWDEWLTQCRASMDFYENQFGRKIGRLHLSGGSSRLAGFQEWLQEAVGLPVEQWNPLSGVESGPDLREEEAPGSRFGVAVGLAASSLMK